MHRPTNDPTYQPSCRFTQPGLASTRGQDAGSEHNPDFSRVKPEAITWQTVCGWLESAVRQRTTQMVGRKRIAARTTVAPASSREDLVEAKQLALCRRHPGSLEGRPAKETVISKERASLMSAHPH